MTSVVPPAKGEIKSAASQPDLYPGCTRLAYKGKSWVALGTWTDDEMRHAIDAIPVSIPAPLPAGIPDTLKAREFLQTLTIDIPDEAMTYVCAICGQSECNGHQLTLDDRAHVECQCRPLDKHDPWGAKIYKAECPLHRGT